MFTVVPLTVVVVIFHQFATADSVSSRQNKISNQEWQLYVHKLPILLSFKQSTCCFTFLSVLKEKQHFKDTKYNPQPRARLCDVQMINDNSSVSMIKNIASLALNNMEGSIHDSEMCCIYLRSALNTKTLRCPKPQTTTTINPYVHGMVDDGYECGDPLIAIYENSVMQLDAKKYCRAAKGNTILNKDLQRYMGCLRKVLGPRFIQPSKTKKQPYFGCQYPATPAPIYMRKFD